MDYKITGYEPAQLFHFFEEVSAIPRGSGNEKGICDFLVTFAKERGLDVYQDEVYNVIIRKPASAGAENAPPVLLQGHIDMVCDKLGSVEHDFTTDGIDLVVKDGGITLTDAGRAIAEKIYERHRLLSGILMQLGVDEKTAAEDACKMEHVISDASMEAIKRHAAGRIK